MAAFATAVRAEIPTKPQRGYKLNAWVQKVKTVKELMRHADEKGVPALMDEWRRPKHILAPIAHKVDLLQALARQHWNRIGRVEYFPDAYRFESSSMARIPSPHATAAVDGRTVRATTLDELRAEVVERVGAGKTEAKMQFEVRGVGTRDKGTWRINKKGDPLRRPLKVFADTETNEAFEFIKNHHDELVAAWEAVKERDNVKETDLRRPTNRVRTAEDYRQGRDATPEMFTQAFGFRGVEFGNWVSQGSNAKERQGMMNEAYDALHDLASILKVPTKALSLNGQLGLGFGSRGHGHFAAHYEPGTIVINLTKTRGAGSLAHEFFHALDHYFQRFRGTKLGYITEAPETRYVNTKTGHTLSVDRWKQLQGRHGGRLYNEADWKLMEGVRPEVEESFAALVKALDESPMAQRARLNDKGKQGYWGSTIERAARAFENYVIHKMQQQGYHNDYLANVVSIEDFARDPGRYPYLLGEEIEPVAKAFDDLFGTIQTKETDKGVMLFSAPKRSMSAETKQVQDAAIDAIFESLHGSQTGKTPPPRLGQDHGRHYGRLAQRALEGATGNRASSVQSPSGGERTQQAAVLADWARENGLLITRLPAEYQPGGENDIGQMEHHVWSTPDGKRVVKLTKPGKFGLWPVVDGIGVDLREKESTPLRYLSRVNDSNAVFEDDQVLHGVLIDRRGGVQILTSQPDYDGDSPGDVVDAAPEGEQDRMREEQMREIQQALAEEGFLPVSFHRSTYYRKSDNTAVFDAHLYNVVSVDTPEFHGWMPFDVVVMHPQGRLRDNLRNAVVSPATKPELKDDLLSSGAKRRSFTSNLGAELQRSAAALKGGPTAGEPKADSAAAFPPADLKRFIDAATKGLSTAYAPLERVFIAAKSVNPTLTEREFGQRISAADAAGQVMLEPAETPAAIQKANVFGVKMSSGVPAWGVTLSPDFETGGAGDRETLSSGAKRSPEGLPKETKKGEKGSVPESFTSDFSGSFPSFGQSGIDDAAHEAATSPRNDLPEPTPAQKEAGNYAKGHVRIGGHDISIENPAGSKRRPEWPALKDHYGYIRSVRVPTNGFAQPAVTDAETAGNASQTFPGLQAGIDAGKVITDLVAAVSKSDLPRTENTAQRVLVDPKSSGYLGARNAFANELLRRLKIPREGSRKGIESQFLEATRDGLAADSKLFGDGVQGMLLRTQGFDALDIQGKAMVERHVRSAIQNPQVLRAIIQLVPVDVMNMLGGRKIFSTEDDAVLFQRFTASLDNPVMIGRLIDGVAASLPAALALRIAERVGQSVKTPLAAMQNGPATGTGNGGHESPSTRVSPKGKDGDHVDVFVKPGTPTDFAGDVYVVRQITPATGRFDEWKVMMGYDSITEAEQAYRRNYTPGWKGLNSIAALSMDDFTQLLAAGVFETAGAADTALASAAKRGGMDNKSKMKYSVAGAVAPVAIASGIATAGSAVVEKAGLQQVLAKMGSNKVDAFAGKTVPSALPSAPKRILDGLSKAEWAVANTQLTNRIAAPAVKAAAVFKKAAAATANKLGVPDVEAMLEYLAEWSVQGHASRHNVDATKLTPKQLAEYKAGQKAVFRRLWNQVKRQILPDSAIPADILAKRQEMNAATSLANEKALDIGKRAFKGKAKFTDMALDERYQNPEVKRKMFLAMDGQIASGVTMDNLNPDERKVAETLKALRDEHAQARLREGRLSLDAYHRMKDGMPHYYAQDVKNERSIGRRMLMGLKRTFAQRGTAFHIVDTATKDAHGADAIVPWTPPKSKKATWWFKHKEQMDAHYEQHIQEQILAAKNATTAQRPGDLSPEERKSLKSYSWMTDTDRAALAGLTREKLNAPATLTKEQNAVVERLEEQLRRRFQKKTPLTFNEHERAGLIMDPFYAVARQLAEAGHDNAVAGFFNHIAANPEYTSDVAQAGYTEISDTPSMGRLAGKWVRDDIAAEIQQMTEIPSMVAQLYDWMMSLFKVGHTVLNPGSHTRNVIGNIVFAHLAGNNPLNPGNFQHYRQAAEMLRSGEGLENLYKLGILGGDYLTAEIKRTLRQLMPDAKTVMDEIERGNMTWLLNLKEHMARKVSGMAAVPGKVGHAVLDTMSNAWKWEDDIYKVSAFLKAKSEGMTDADAAAHVRENFAFYDGGQSSLLKATGRFVFPFLSFKRESLRLLGNGLRKKPVMVLTTLLIPRLLTQMALTVSEYKVLMALFGAGLGTDDERDKEDILKDLKGKSGRVLAPFTDESLFSILLPWRDEHGGTMQYDLSNVHPFADWLGTRIEDDEKMKWWQRAAQELVAGSPFIGLLGEAYSNKDAFSGRKLWEEDMTDAEAAGEFVKHAVMKLAPPPLSVHPAGLMRALENSPSKLMPQRSFWQQLSRTLGVDIKPAGPDLYRKAAEYREANHLPASPEGDTYSRDAANRARVQLYFLGVQDVIDVDAFAEQLDRLDKLGKPMTHKGLVEMFKRKKPESIMARKADQQKFIRSLPPESARIMESAKTQQQAALPRALRALSEARKRMNYTAGKP
ncbi:MAG: LPD1 domain-containing protein [Prosthecobacter sp.]